MNLRSVLIIGLLLVLFSVSASAWSEYTATKLCERAVDELWGENTRIECIDEPSTANKKLACSLLSFEDRVKCDLVADDANPTAIPYGLGDEIIENKGDCPIKEYAEGTNLCTKEETAWDKAKYWLNQSRYSQNKCERVYTYCIASTYIALANYPLNTINQNDQSCRDGFNTQIDASLKYQRTRWGFNRDCTYTYKPASLVYSGGRDYTTSINVNSDMLESVYLNISTEGKAFYKNPFTVRVATTTTMPELTTIQTTTTTISEEQIPGNPLDEGKPIDDIVLETTSTIALTTTTWKAPTTTNAPQTTITIEQTTTTMEEVTTTTLENQMPSIEPEESQTEESNFSLIYVVAGVILVGALLFIILRPKQNRTTQPPQRTSLGGFTSGGKQGFQTMGASRLSDPSIKPQPKTEKDIEEKPPEPPQTAEVEKQTAMEARIESLIKSNREGTKLGEK